MSEVQWKGVFGKPSVGAALLEFNSVNIENITGTHSLADLSLLKGMAFLLCISEKGRLLPWGSGVMLGPGLGVTAKHVWTEFEQNLDLLHRKDYNLLAFSPVGNEIRIWMATHIVACPDADICLIRLNPLFELGEHIVLTCPSVDLEYPGVGDRILSFGYKCSDTQFARGSGIPLEMFVASGQVTQVLYSGRDRAMITGPCFEFAADISHGMSGGPVFNDRGHLIGINSSSWSFLEGGTPSSWASLLVPLFSLEISRVMSPMDLGNMAATNLFEIGHYGLVCIQGVEALQSG